MLHASSDANTASRTMPVRPILKMGDARLLRTARRVEHFDTPALLALVTDLHDTMLHAGGVGLAAPQIGVDLAVVIFGFETSLRYPDAPPVPKTVLINPAIEPIDAQQAEDWEGCLSVPGLRGKVPRFHRIQYSGWDPEGQRIEREADGFHARVVQHECDHLLGVLYPKRIRDFSAFGFTEVLFPNLTSAAERD